MKNKLILEYFHKVTNANKKAAKFIKENPPQYELTVTRLSRFRGEIK